MITLKKLLILVLLLFVTFAAPLVIYGATSKPLPRDVQGSAIQAVSSVIRVQNVSITSASYVAITLPPEVYCKSIYIKTRSGNSWRLATQSNPSAYMLVDFNMSLAIVAYPGKTIFYAIADSASDTLEIIYMD